MSDAETDSLSPISFTYESAGHGWARVWISDRQTTYFMDPSYVPSDPLFCLMAAVLKVLTYSDEAECTWFYEPAKDRWLLVRDGDQLHITIRRVRDRFSYPNLPPELGEVKFSTTCDLWKFAHKVRLAVSRLEPVAERYYDPTPVKGTAEYRALCTFLDEHKEAQHPPSRKSRKR